MTTTKHKDDPYAPAIAGALNSVRALREQSRDAVMLPQGSDAAWLAEQRALQIVGELQILCLKHGIDFDAFLDRANEMIEAEDAVPAARRAA